MAESLLSLMTPGTMKHVVPWKTRAYFLAVYQDLYSGDRKSIESAIGRIAAWKSRAGNKLSVAIESSGMLMQVLLQHQQAERDGKLSQVEQQLRYSYSLALIRFVNHVTEKAQTKAVAQPVHLVAREFGIPEWIVRLRHDATHGALPCLDAVATGTKWALDYLRENFWEQQKVDSNSGSGNADDSKDSIPGSKEVNKSPRTDDIRRAFYDFQKIRYQKSNSDGEDKTRGDHTAALGKLQKYLSLNRMKFIKCLLEDGILIATEEQLQAFGVDTEDLVSELPPTIPQRMALFWRPLLKRVSNNVGALAFLMDTAMFSVTSEDGLRNYQLVAWVAFILANTSSTEATSRGKRRKHRETDCFMRTAQPIPTSTLLSMCLQNLNRLTAHLLRHLVTPENMGAETYAKLTQLLQVAPPPSPCPQQTGGPGTAESQAEQADSASSSGDSDSDSACSLGGIKGASSTQGYGKISSSTLEEIERIVGHDAVSWNLCTDQVDWSTIPLGMLPDQVPNKLGDGSSDDDDHAHGGDGDAGRRKQGRGKSRRRSRRERRGEKSNDEDEEDEEEDEDSDDPDHDISPKRSKLIVKDDLLI